MQKFGNPSVNAHRPRESGPSGIILLGVGLVFVFDLIGSANGDEPSRMAAPTRIPPASDPIRDSVEELRRAVEQRDGPVGDIEAMAEAILEALDTPADIDALRRRAMDFHVDRIVERYCEVLGV